MVGLSETHYENCGERITEEGHGYWFSGDYARQTTTRSGLHRK